MIVRILTSNWFAVIVLAVAAFSLVLLHREGKTVEALVGAGLLVLAALLVYWGMNRNE
jgi:predicted tellurium resistance membrane protein TerC